jgi:hypothetical protein
MAVDVKSRSTRRSPASRLLHRAAWWISTAISGAAEYSGVHGGELAGGPVSVTVGVDYDRMQENRKGFVNNFGFAGALRRDEDDTVYDFDSTSGGVEVRAALATLGWRAALDRQVRFARLLHRRREPQ